MRHPLVIGVTGGIGAGKSAVCAAFEKRGVPVIDTDQVAREVVMPGTAGLAEVVAAFGPGVLTAEGTMDRAAVRRLVFGNPANRVRLEAILHPRIRARVAEHLARVTAPYCLLGIPLLVESGNRTPVDRVLVVDCPEALQVSRVMARDKLTDEEVRAIMRSQASRQERLARADDVVMNAGDLSAIESQVDDLHARYLVLASARDQA